MPEVPPLPSIHELLDEMDIEVGRCLDSSDRRGYFALMYRGVTRRVRDGLRDGEFPDGPLMEELDVLFARRWLDACHGWWNGTSVTGPWLLTSDASHNTRLLLIQHLLLGMNAHINLDLGIAAADTVARHPGMSIEDLEADFTAINEVLGSLIDTMQDAMATVSPWMGLVDWASARLDEGVSGFAIEIARTEAWQFAVALSEASDSERDTLIADRERITTTLGRHIADPPWLIRLAALVVRLRERHDLHRVEQALDGVSRGVR